MNQQSSHAAAEGVAIAQGLDVAQLSSGYGRAPVLFGVDVHVAPGEIVAILGHNGAGKSTLLKSVLGLLPATGGSIRFAGRDVTTLPSHQRVRAGMAYSPQYDFVFRDLTVRDNLRLAGFTVASQRKRTQGQDEVFELFPILRDRLDQRAGTLSGGQQRMLSIGIALLSEPSLVILDEPSLGIAPKLLHEVMLTLRRLVDQHGISLVLAEQNVREAAMLADRAYVLRRGAVIHEGAAAELLDRDEIWELF